MGRSEKDWEEQKRIGKIGTDQRKMKRDCRGAVLFVCGRCAELAEQSCGICRLLESGGYY